MPVMPYPVAAMYPAAAVVGDLDGQLLIAAVDGYPAVAGAGVADHVGHRLLDDAEGGQVDLSGKRRRSPLHRTSTRTPASKVVAASWSRSARPGAGCMGELP